MTRNTCPSLLVFGLIVLLLFLEDTLEDILEGLCFLFLVLLRHAEHVGLSLSVSKQERANMFFLLADDFVAIVFLSSFRKTESVVPSHMVARTTLRFPWRLLLVMLVHLQYDRRHFWIGFGSKQTKTWSDLFFFLFHLGQTKTHSSFGQRLSFEAELSWLPFTHQGPFVSCVVFASATEHFSMQGKQGGHASKYLSRFYSGSDNHEVWQWQRASRVATAALQRATCQSFRQLPVKIVT